MVCLKYLVSHLAMRPLFHPRLIHDPFGDPGLYVAWMHGRRSLLFDLPELSLLPPGDLLRVSQAFISHTHMDHFVGLDRLVRLNLGRSKRLRLFGPHPLLEQTSARLRSYTWNLVSGYKERLVIEVNQVRGDVLERAVLDCRQGFEDSGMRDLSPFDGILWEESGMRVRAALLDHKVPSMAFCLEEPIHVQVLKGKLEEHGLQRGSWLRRLREALLEGAPPDLPVEVRPPGRGPIPLGWLREHLVCFSRGQRMGYVVDAAPSKENARRIVELVRGADVLFIEAPFPEREYQRARQRAHLTALRAGTIAAMARVSKVVPFHFSPKYGPDPSSLQEEVQVGFQSLVKGPTQEIPFRGIPHDKACDSNQEGTDHGS